MIAGFFAPAAKIKGSRLLLSTRPTSLTLGPKGPVSRPYTQPSKGLVGCPSGRMKHQNEGGRLGKRRSHRRAGKRNRVSRRQRYS